MSVGLLVKLLPLYALIGLVYIGGKYLKIDAPSFARLLIYLIVPVVFFGYTARVNPEPDVIALPFIIYGISAAVLALSYLLACACFHDARRNLTAATAAGCNSGYFGVPVFIMLFGEADLGVYMLGVMGFTLNELTWVYFTMARGHFSVQESLMRLVRLPAIYAGIMGLLFAALRIPLPDTVIDIITQFRGTYIVLGMMLIGIGLSAIERLHIDWRYLAFSLLGRFCITSALCWLVIWMAGDHILLPIKHTLMLLGLLPLAANTVAYAVELKLYPAQAATAVLISTMLAALLLPLMAPWLVGDIQH